MYCPSCGALIEARLSISDSTSYSLPSQLCSDCLEMYNNSHRTQIRRSSDDREWDLFHLETQPMSLWRKAVGEREGVPTGVGEDPENPCSVGGFQTLSLEHHGLPQQESCNLNEQNQQVPYPLVMPSNSKVPTEATEENNNGDQELDCNLGEQQSIKCILVLFKRGIISQAQLIHILYIIPKEKFSLVFPRVKQCEATAYHGTEFPFVWGNGSPVKCTLSAPVLITGGLKVWYEMVCGKNFQITNPSDMAVSLSIAKIQADCEERIAPGTTVKLCMECTGSQDAFWEDTVRLTLSTGDRTLLLHFPVACHKTNIVDRFSLQASVTRMPDEDREALRSCHVTLMNNIGNVVSICEHLFQFEILNGDDIEEIKSIRKPSERNADFLRRLPSRGDVLDLLIEIMRGQRENQGAANILQHQRCPKK